jgi:hypothetical protein
MSSKNVDNKNQEIEIVSSKKTLNDIDFFLKIPRGISLTGFISICISFIFEIFDMEIIGYFIISFGILLSFLILLTYKLFVDKNSQKTNNLESPSSIFSKVMQGFIIFKNRIPALLLFSQFIGAGIVYSMIKDWVLSVKTPPPIYSKTRRWVTLGLIIQYIIYQIHYVKSIKDNTLSTFNTAGFAIISLGTFSMIMYLYVIVKLFTVDG